jgi:dUTP pyrophosphatase
MSILKYMCIDSTVQAPTKATSQSACYDLRAHFGPSTQIVSAYSDSNVSHNLCAFKTFDSDRYAIVLKPGYRALIPTGYIFDIPEGYSVRLHIRSGLALKNGLTLANAEGVIDSDYTKQCYVLVHNTSSVDAKISHGDRIAQFEMVPVLNYSLQQVDYRVLDDKTDRKGGFGSTGV